MDEDGDENVRLQLDEQVDEQVIEMVVDRSLSEHMNTGCGGNILLDDCSDNGLQVGNQVVVLNSSIEISDSGQTETANEASVVITSSDIECHNFNTESSGFKLDQSSSFGQNILPIVSVKNGFIEPTDPQISAQDNVKLTDGTSDYFHSLPSIESCLDSTWSEELVLMLISAVTSKKEWKATAKPDAFFREFLIQAQTAGYDLSLEDACQKWNEVYTTYLTIAKSLQSTSLGVTDQSELFNALHSACTARGSSEEASLAVHRHNSDHNESATQASSQIVTSRRKPPEFHWSADVTRRFINLRADKHDLVAVKGHTAVYNEILEELGISEKVSVMMARKKWNYLINRYQDECSMRSPSTWVMMADMVRVMSRFVGLDTSKLKSRASPEFLWPDELTNKFIDLRVQRNEDFAKLGLQATYGEILQELGVGHVLTPQHLRKKWNYLIAKHKEVTGFAPDSSHCNWPFYERMSAAVAAIQSSTPSAAAEHKFDEPSVVSNDVTSTASKPEHCWTRSLILRFINLRAARALETKSTATLYSGIITELNLSGVIKPHQARKKWNYLWNKYLELSQPVVSEYARKSWPYYEAMSAAAAVLPRQTDIHGRMTDDDHQESIEFVPVLDDPKSVKISTRKHRPYSCYLCSSSSTLYSDFFVFEYDQRLLHTQKTALELIFFLLGKKHQHYFERVTLLCSRCTTLLNEADSVISRHDKIQQEVRTLFDNKMQQQLLLSSPCSQPKREYDVILSATGDLESCSPPAIEIEVDSISSGHDQGDEDFKPPPEVKSSIITYSSRGRKRKSTIFTEAIQKCVKIEPTEDGGLTSYDCDVIQCSSLDRDDRFNQSDDDYEGNVSTRKRGITVRNRGRRGRRGRGRGRGRTAARSTLIGRGLDGKYPANNKRKVNLLKETKVYSCSECSEEFSRYVDLIAHRKEMHVVIDNTPLEVEETVLHNGVITYFNKDKPNNIDTCHKCKECDKLFLRKDDLSYHVEVSHTDGKGRTKTAFKNKSYTCEECGESFLFKYKLKLHINSKHLNDAGTSSKDFTCGECGSKLGSLPGLTFHMRKHHNKVLNYKRNTDFLCSDCGYMAPSAKKLKEHQEAHCGVAAKKQVQCEICGKTVLKVSLKMHKIKMHSDFKEQCDRCGERYATKTDLLRHINVVHLKILLYACKLCESKFPTSDALRYHRVKAHEKPIYFCSMCNKNYKRVGELNTHLKRVHYDRRKAEVCPHCGKEYYDRSGLRNHLMSKHNVAHELTYSESYLRKKRVDGLPLAKHFEKRGIDSFCGPALGANVVDADTDKQEITMITHGQLQEMIQAGSVVHGIVEHHQLEGEQHHVIVSHPESERAQDPHNVEMLHAQHHIAHHPHLVATTTLHHHAQPQQVLVSDSGLTVAGRALRSTNSYVTTSTVVPGCGEEEASLVVAEITEDDSTVAGVTEASQILIEPLCGVLHPHLTQQHHHIVANGVTVHQQQQVGQLQSYGVMQAAHHASPVMQHQQAGRVGVIYQVGGQPHHATDSCISSETHINMQ